MTDRATNLSAARRDPNIAACLTWLVPGAGHVYIGRVGWGVALCLIIEGLYFAGLRLSNGMGFEFLDPELRNLVAPVLSPEMGNLGGVLWQMKHFGFGTDHPRPWPEWIVLGTTMTAISGMLNGVAMCHAHTLARSAVTSSTETLGASGPAFAALLAWLVPGLGHFYQGRRRRGAIVFALLVGLFALACVLAEGSNLSRERHFYYWAGQFVIGLPSMVAEALWGEMRIDHDIPYVEAGLVFGCVSGLLNVLAMLDVYGYAETKLFATAPQVSVGAPAISGVELPTDPTPQPNSAGTKS